MALPRLDSQAQNCHVPPLAQYCLAQIFPHLERLRPKQGRPDHDLPTGLGSGMTSVAGLEGLRKLPAIG